MRKGKTRKIGNLDEIEMLPEAAGILKFSPVDLADEINKLLDEPPSKKTAEYKEWKAKVNLLMRNYNEICGWRCFIEL